MKIARFTIVIPLAASLMACASTQDRDGDYQPNLQDRYMSAVQNQARGYSTRVHWVNPPSQKTLAALYGIDDEED